MNKVKFMIAFVMAIVAGNAFAQKLTAADVRIDAGKNARVVFSLDAEEKASLVQFTVVLPDGFTVYQKYDEDNDEYKNDAVKGSICFSSPTITLSQDGNELTVVLYKASDETFSDTKGEFLKIGLKAADTVENGQKSATIKDIKVGKPGGISIGDFPNSTFTIGVGEDPIATGISNISIDDPNAQVFNLQGQRVDGKSAKKGVYVVNGKKVAVK